MSKKDFIALADLMRRMEAHYNQSHPENWNDTPREVLEHVRLSLAQFCKDNNSRFMVDRWLSYIAGKCGPNGGAVKKAE